MIRKKTKMLIKHRKVFLVFSPLIFGLLSITTKSQVWESINYKMKKVIKSILPTLMCLFLSSYLVGQTCTLMSGTCDACDTGNVSTAIDLASGGLVIDALQFGPGFCCQAPGVSPTYDNTTNMGTLSLLAGQVNTFAVSGASGLIFPCVVNDLCLTADIEVVSGTFPFTVEFRIENGGGAPGNGGQALTFDAVVDGTGSCTIGGGLADGIPANDFTFAPCTDAYTIAFALADFSGNPVASDIVVNLSNIQLNICSPAPVADDTGAVCSGEGTDDLSTCQAAVEAANPAGLVVYSSVMPVAGITPPDGILPNGVAPAGCASVDQTVMAYKFCDKDQSSGDSAGDIYTLQSTYTLTAAPLTQVPSSTENGCEVSLTPSCTNDTYSNPTNPTGGAAIANFNSATGVYTAQSGDAAGTLGITVTNEFSCTTTYTISTCLCRSNLYPYRCL